MVMEATLDVEAQTSTGKRLQNKKGRDTSESYEEQMGQMAS